jgi:hypothetical protein
MNQRTNNTPLPRRTNSLAFATTDCHRCITYVKRCDRLRPQCSTCLQRGQKCPGFVTPLFWDTRRSFVAEPVTSKHGNKNNESKERQRHDSDGKTKEARNRKFHFVERSSAKYRKVSHPGGNETTGFQEPFSNRHNVGSLSSQQPLRADSTFTVDVQAETRSRPEVRQAAINNGSMVDNIEANHDALVADYCSGYPMVRGYGYQPRDKSSRHAANAVLSTDGFGASSFDLTADAMNNVLSPLPESLPVLDPRHCDAAAVPPDYIVASPCAELGGGTLSAGVGGVVCSDRLSQASTTACAVSTHNRTISRSPDVVEGIVRDRCEQPVNWQSSTD